MTDYLDKYWEDVCTELDKQKLHFAAQEGNLQAVKDLAQEGFAINAFDDLARTPLHYAAINEHTEVAKFLIGAGADVNAHDDSQIGNTPLCQIAGNCSYAMAKLLIDAGADPSIPGWMQLTALDGASKRKRGDGPKVYDLLLKAKKKFESNG